MYKDSKEKNYTFFNKMRKSHSMIVRRDIEIWLTNLPIMAISHSVWLPYFMMGWLPNHTNLVGLNREFMSKTFDEVYDFLE